MVGRVGYAAEERCGAKEYGAIQTHDVSRSSDYVLCRQEPFDDRVIVLQMRRRILALTRTLNIKNMRVFRVHYL
jgi:hypothetical protein